MGFGMKSASGGSWGGVGGLGVFEEDRRVGDDLLGPYNQ